MKQICSKQQVKRAAGQQAASKNEAGKQHVSMEHISAPAAMRHANSCYWPQLAHAPQYGGRMAPWNAREAARIPMVPWRLALCGPRWSAWRRGQWSAVSSAGSVLFVLRTLETAVACVSSQGGLPVATLPAP